MNELSRKCEGLAKAEQGLARTIGIWGLYALSLGKNCGPVVLQAGNEDYLAEVAGAEREFAQNHSLRMRRSVHAKAAHLATRAVEEQVCP